MSSIANHQEKQVEECTLDVASPFHNEVECFDNSDLYPDLEFFVAGMTNPLQLHKKILALTSEYMKKKLKEIREQRLDWTYDSNKEVDRNALVKVLRFCYGESMTVGTKNGDCIAVIATLVRLQVLCREETIEILKNFALTQAKKDVKVGVELLKACAGYPECCEKNSCELNKELAGIILTKEKMHEHYKEVVDECLMVLPPEYLKWVEFGKAHTKWSEFCLKTKYLRLHRKELSNEEKQLMMIQCDWSMLNSQELRELRLVDIIDKDELLEAYEKALEYCEIENERATEIARMAEKNLEERVAEIEKQKEEEKKRTEKAESEAEKLQQHAEKEKEKEMKRLSMERDKYAKEAEEYKKRAETAEKEKEEMKQAEMEKDKKLKAGEVERDKLRKEAEEFKRRAQKAESDRSEESKRAMKAEAEGEYLRRRAENAERERDEYKRGAERIEVVNVAPCPRPWFQHGVPLSLHFAHAAGNIFRLTPWRNPK